MVNATQMNCGLGSAGGFSGKKKKRKHCIILLLITRRRELPIHLKLKKGISSISKPKVDFKVKTSNQNKFLYFKMEQNSMIITYKKD
jgi:hypothetical protein